MLSSQEPENTEEEDPRLNVVNSENKNTGKEDPRLNVVISETENTEEEDPRLNVVISENENTEDEDRKRSQDCILEAQYSVYSQKDTKVRDRYKLVTKHKSTEIFDSMKGTETIVLRSRHILVVSICTRSSPCWAVNLRKASQLKIHLKVIPAILHTRITAGNTWGTPKFGITSQRANYRKDCERIDREGRRLTTVHTADLPRVWLSWPEIGVCGFSDEPRLLGLVMVPGRHIVTIHFDYQTQEKDVWKHNPVGRRPRGRPKNRWKDQVEKDLRKLRAGQGDCEDRERWRQLVGEAKYHLGYPWPWEHLLEQAQCTVRVESSLCLVLQHRRSQVRVVAGVHPQSRQTLVVPLVLGCHPCHHKECENLIGRWNRVRRRGKKISTACSLFEYILSQYRRLNSTTKTFLAKKILIDITTCSISFIGMVLSSHGEGAPTRSEAECSDVTFWIYITQWVQPREQLEYQCVCYLGRITSCLVVLNITCFTTKDSFTKSKIESLVLSFGFVQCEFLWAFSSRPNSGITTKWLLSQRVTPLCYALWLAGENQFEQSSRHSEHSEAVSSLLTQIDNRFQFSLCYSVFR
ncbi:hypothetical protein J6590_044058 [Homalodisca vitripennis]|nr:hypothetical protein J6590_044058 [Homalodisca vitripennis]